MTEQKVPYKINGRPPTIFRTMRDGKHPYDTSDKHIMDDKSLSWKAKGLLIYLLNRPDGWEVSVSDLINRSKDGKSSVRAGLQELRDGGYIRYVIAREKGKFAGWIIEVHEEPFTDNRKVVEVSQNTIVEPLRVVEVPQNKTLEPFTEKPQVEKPQVVNRTQVLKNLSNKEESNRFWFEKQKHCQIEKSLDIGSSTALEGQSIETSATNEDHPDKSTRIQMSQKKNSIWNGNFVPAPPDPNPISSEDIANERTP